ncbi:7068_t:CDS:1, partial [Gigaspora margarita]
VPIIAYANDMTFIAQSKKKLEKILEIAIEFYNLNNIKINSKKLELL